MKQNVWANTWKDFKIRNVGIVTPQLHTDSNCTWIFVLRQNYFLDYIKMENIFFVKVWNMTWFKQNKKNTSTNKFRFLKPTFILSIWEREQIVFWLLVLLMHMYYLNFILDISFIFLSQQQQLHCFTRHGFHEFHW